MPGFMSDSLLAHELIRIGDEAISRENAGPAGMRRP
jgi:hypothetical protein